MNTLKLTDDELAHVIACLGRVDDPAGFPDALGFYERVLDQMPGRCEPKREHYYRNTTFSSKRVKSVLSTR